MSKLNFSIFLNAYKDRNPSNAPSQNNFRWDRYLNSVEVNNPYSLEFTLAPGESRTLFSGTRVLTQNGTTEYSISLKSFTTTTYLLSWVAGTNPGFRTSRISGADATTQVTVTQNGPVMTFTSTGGTPFSLTSGGVVVGDYARIGNLFNQANQGPWQIISLTNTSFSVVNAGGVPEGPITLGSSFGLQIDLYSAAGVQIGDTLAITGGFSPVTQGTYEITDVSDMFIAFSSLAVLPTEGPITTEAISVYSSAKNMIYLETDQNCSALINGSFTTNIIPLVKGECGCPKNHGFLFLTSSVYSLTVTNNSSLEACMYLASIE